MKPVKGTVRRTVTLAASGSGRGKQQNFAFADFIFMIQVLQIQRTICYKNNLIVIQW